MHMMIMMMAFPRFVAFCGRTVVSYSDSLWTLALSLTVISHVCDECELCCCCPYSSSSTSNLSAFTWTASCVGTYSSSAEKRIEYEEGGSVDDGPVPQGVGCSSGLLRRRGLPPGGCPGASCIFKALFMGILRRCSCRSCTILRVLEPRASERGVVSRILGFHAQCSVY